jgi:hypothetical protein
MTSRWGLDEKHIGKKVKKVGKKLQQASKQTILLNASDFDAKEIIILSVDCVNYPTTEFRLDPGTEWYDHKSHGPGLKYEYAVCVHHVSSSLYDLQSSYHATATATDILFPLIIMEAILCLDQGPISCWKIQ